MTDEGTDTPQVETEVVEQEDRKYPIGKIVFGVLAVLVLVFIVLFSYVASRGAEEAAERSKKTTAKVTKVANKVGGYDYTLKVMHGYRGRIINSGFPKGSTPAKKKSIVLNAAAHDPLVLWYFLTRVYEMDGNVPSDVSLRDTNLRIEWHKKLQTLVAASSFKNVSLEGLTFFNEGFNGNGRVTASETSFGQGIEGTEIAMGGKTSLVKNNCCNKQNVRRPSRVIILKPSREGKPCEPVNDVGTPPNKTYVPSWEAARSPHKGYKPENAETVVQERERSSGGGSSKFGSGGESSGNSGGEQTPAPTKPAGPAYSNGDVVGNPGLGD